MGAPSRGFIKVACCCVLVAILGGCTARRSATSDLDATVARLREALAVVPSEMPADGQTAAKEELKAVAQLLEAEVRVRPDSATAHGNLGVAYWQLGRIKNAGIEFLAAAELAPDDARPLELVARFLTQLRYWDDARMALDRAFQRNPDSPRILTSMAIVEARAGPPALAHDLLVAALEMEPNYPPALYNMAVLHRDFLENPAAARTYFQKYVACDESAVADGLSSEQMPDAKHLEIARAYLSGDLPRHGTHRGAAAIGTPADDSLLLKARKAVQADALDQALIILRKVVADYPDYPDALWELAKLYEVHLEDRAPAIEAYEAFHRRFPDDPRTLVPIPPPQPKVTTAPHPPPDAPGPPPDVPGNPAAPVPEPQRTPMPDPDAALRVWTKGLQSHNMGKWDDAIADYRRALELDDSLISAAYNLGLVYREKGDLPSAQRAFAHALRVKPDMLQAHYMLAVTYRDMKRPTDAIGHLEQAMEVDPDYGRAHFVLGLIHDDQGQLALARHHFQRTVELIPNDPNGKKAREWLQKNPRR